MFDYYDEPYCEAECFECESKDNQLDDVKYWLKYLLDQLYSSKELDLIELERTLEELGHIVNVNLPERDLSIERRTFLPQAYSLPLESWKEFNHNYLKQIAVSE